MPAWELLVVLLLIVLNGFFAMSELAIVSAKRSRLEQMAKAGSAGAARAARLLDDPTGFLSTVQIGITLIGIFAGAYSGTTFAQPLSEVLAPIIGSPGAALTVAFALVVVGTTYVSLIVGELVPKRIALNHAEAIASFVSGPMLVLSRIGLPLVWFLRLSTNSVLRLLGMSTVPQQTVTEEDVKALILEGAQSGVFEQAEHDMLEAVMRLADRSVRSIMVPRREVVWVSTDDSRTTILGKIKASGHSRLPLCRNGIDDVVGVIHVKDLFHSSAATPDELIALARQPLYIGETMEALRLMDRFRESAIHMAIVLDEYGAFEGLVTPTDILMAITGDLPHGDQTRGDDAVQRADGSWLLDASMDVHDVGKVLTSGFHIPPDADYVTLAGFVLEALGHIPVVGETLEAGEWTLEIVDLDGHRIDKVLATPIERQDAAETEND